MPMAPSMTAPAWLGSNANPSAWLIGFVSIAAVGSRRPSTSVIGFTYLAGKLAVRIKKVQIDGLVVSKIGFVYGETLLLARE